jgi:hypothetical protein
MPARSPATVRAAGVRANMARSREAIELAEKLSAEHFEEVEKALDAAGVPPGGHYRVTKDEPKETT